ncbi:hypothetical protein GGR56DRAFT_669689 [Xylariaceae sp. FL0804]|nr:hypothetical protein GGR56DRAFT_669689 [Xylariaceae sp. FL0804]
MDPESEDELLHRRTHPLKIFDVAKSQGRFLYACAPMVRYSKLAFRQTVHHYGTDLCWTPMMLAKEFNRSAFARDGDLTVATTTGGDEELPTVAQFGASSPLELARAAALAAPFVNGVDLNCGCPQSWACAETLGAALMERRDLVRDMVVATRRRLADDGWGVAREADADRADGRGRSVSVKIRVHADLRRTVDFITTVLGDEHRRNIDWLTIHPRTRSTPSSSPINLEALELLTDMFGDRLPVLVSGDVFTLASLPYTSHLLGQQQSQSPTLTCTTSPKAGPLSRSRDDDDDDDGREDGMPGAGEDGCRPAAAPAVARPHLPKLAGLMSARALLANPALFAGFDTCPWEAVDVFMGHVARAPLPLKLGVHHLMEMCGPGFGPDRSALLPRKKRAQLTECANWIDVIDFMDEAKRAQGAGAPASSSGLSRGATAGAALGAVLGLSILAALLAWLLVLPHYRRRRAAAQPDYRMGGLLRSDIVPAERRRGPDAAAQTRILTLTAYEKQPQELGTGAEVAEVERERPRPAVELEADVPVPGTERAEEQEGTQVPGSGAESARLGQSA